MNKISKNLIVLFLAFLIGSSFNVDSAQAQENKLILGVVTMCDIKYSGDSCVAELRFINNTGKILDGKAFLHIGYQGMRSNNKLIDFDGDGIKAQFSINNSKWLNFSDDWKNGTTTVVSDFEIAKGETQPKLEIETIPNLYPGKYTFNLELKGTTEEGEEIIIPLSVIVGGGGYYYQKNIIEEDTQTIDDMMPTATTIIIKDTGNIIKEKTTSDPFIINKEITIPEDLISEDLISTVIFDIETTSKSNPLIIIMILCLLVLLIFIIIRIMWKHRKKWKA